MPNGAQALIRTLVDEGVTTCFTNPGTSEMHFVAALDSVPEMRAVLGLFEGVATGAADGYARMADRPAATLLHLGPGLGNGLANLHNARRAKVAARQHRRRPRDRPRPVRRAAAVRHRVGRAQRLGLGPDLDRALPICPRDAVEAVIAAKGPPGQVATLILPADVSWTDGAEAAAAVGADGAAAPDLTAAVEAVARALRSGGRTAILLGGRALREPRPARRRADRGRDRREAVRRDVPHAHAARRGSAGRRADRVCRRARVGPAERAQAPDAGRRQGARVVLRIPGQEELPRARRLRGARARAAGGRRGGSARGARGRARRRTARARAASAVAARRARPGSLTADKVAEADRRDPARGRDRLRRGGHVGHDAPGATRRERPGTTG